MKLLCCSVNDRISPALPSATYLQPRPQIGLPEKQRQVFVSPYNTFQVAFFVKIKNEFAVEIVSFLPSVSIDVTI